MGLVVWRWGRRRGLVRVRVRVRVGVGVRVRLRLRLRAADIVLGVRG